MPARSALLMILYSLALLPASGAEIPATSESSVETVPGTVGVTMAARPARELPATASRVPLLIVVGLTALAGALTIRAASRSSA